MSEPGRQNQKQPPWDHEREGADRSFGGWLRSQREMRQITLREIAETSKISLRYLEALERDNFEILPAPVFAKGFLREYAKYVGLDADEVINYYLVAQRAREPDVPSEPPSRVQSAVHWTYGLFLTGGVIVLFAIVAGLSFYAERREGRGQNPPPMAAPPIVAEPTPASLGEQARTALPLRVTLDFTQNCTVEAVLDEDRHVHETGVQGESYSLEARERISFRLDNVRGVAVEVNGQPFDPGARNGDWFTIDLGNVTGQRN